MTKQDAITNLIDELLKTIDSQKGLSPEEKTQTRVKFETVVSNFQKEFFQADLTKIVEWTEKNAIVPVLNSATTTHCAEVKKTMEEDTKEISTPDLIASAYQKGKEEHVSDIDIGIDILKSIGSW